MAFGYTITIENQTKDTVSAYFAPLENLRILKLKLEILDGEGGYWQKRWLNPEKSHT